MEPISPLLSDAVERHLADYGVLVPAGMSGLNSFEPQHLALDIADRRVQARGIYLPRLSATAALRVWGTAGDDSPLLVVGPRLHPSSAELLRARGIWYVDGAGNAYLRDRDGLLIDIRGRRSAAPLQAETLNSLDGTEPRNPFTPKRAQVVCILLSAPQLVEAPLRDIAECAGVSVGMAKEAMDTLRTIGFVEHLGTRRRLIRTAELLDLWMAAYPGGLGRANKLLVADGDMHNWTVPDGLEAVVSGEQAMPNDIRNPESLVLYVDTNDTQLPAELLIRNRWHRQTNGKIVIRKLFWRNLPDQRGRVAPAVLVYAELLASYEPRQLEVAHQMRRQDEGLARL